MKTKHIVLPFITLPFLIVCFLAIHVGCAQSYSRYDLKSVNVELLDGTRVKGLLYARGDLLVMNSSLLLVVGCQVKFKMRNNVIEYRGKVEAVTDSTLTILLTDTPETHQMLWRSRIESISVTYPGEILDFSVLKASNIKSIRMHKKGAGVTGAVIGALVGGLLGLALALNVTAHNFDDLATGFVYLGVGVAGGAAVGASVGTSGKKYPINGNPTAFDAFVKKLYHIQ